MKKNKICLLLSILVVACFVIIPSMQVFATDADGGQVSVPGKITFESEAEEVKPTKELPDTTKKKFYSVLPKTGEKSNINVLIGVSFLLVVTGKYYKKRAGDQS